MSWGQKQLCLSAGEKQTRLEALIKTKGRKGAGGQHVTCSDTVQHQWYMHRHTWPRASSNCSSQGSETWSIQLLTEGPPQGRRGITVSHTSTSQPVKNDSCQHTHTECDHGPEWFLSNRKRGRWLPRDTEGMAGQSALRWQLCPSGHSLLCHLTTHTHTHTHTS